MNRKQFLRTGGVLMVAAPILHRPPVASNVLESLLAHPILVQQLGGCHAVYNIGNAYRRQVPHENNRQRLMQLLQQEFAPALLDASEHDALQQAVRARIRNDFASGDVVLVKGWYLSRTEARQCALYSLLHI